VKPSMIDPVLIQMLEDAEVDYALVEGKKHLQLRVKGHMVAILPHGLSGRKGDHRAILNVRGTLRRFLAAGRPGG
jgi:hypothetical protein